MPELCSLCGQPIIDQQSFHQDVLLAAREAREEAAELRSQATALCLEVAERRADGGRSGNGAM